MDEVIQIVDIELKEETLATLNDVTKKITWQLAYPLVSKSHSAGDFQLTTRNFEEIVENFKNRSTGRIPICFEHYASLDAKDMNPLLGNPAHGWVTNLFVGADGSLYGEVELFEPARSYVKEGRYKYMSPAIRFGTRDKLTGQNVGCSIEEVSLTNLPHLEKQKGVWTNSNKNASNSKNNSDKIISSEYNDKNMDEIEKLKLEITKLTLSLQAKDGEITSLKEANAREVKTLSDKLTAVEEEFKKREQEAAKADVDAAFSAYQKTHSLKDTQKEAMLAFRLSDKKAFEAIYPKVVPQATSEVPAFLTTTLTLNENTATQPQSTVSRSKLSPTQLRDKQAALTSQYIKTQNPDTGENYTMTEAIFKAVADLKKEYE